MLGWMYALLPVTTAVSAGSEGSVVSGGARFTVITPNLIRMEYDSSGAFINEPTFFAENRTARDAEAKISRDDDGATIDTGVIHLVYKNDGKPFSAGQTRNGGRSCMTDIT